MVQYYALDKDVSVGHGHASIWAEYLSGTAQVLMRHGSANGWFDGQPAMVTREYGKGRITYIGCVLDANTLDSAVAWMARVSHIQRVFGPVPDGVEVTRRVGTNHKQVFVLINFASRLREVTLPRTMWSVFDKRSLQRVHLDRYGVSVMMSDQ